MFLRASMCGHVVPACVCTCARACVLVCACAYVGLAACVLPGVCKPMSAHVLVSVWTRTVPGPWGGYGPGCPGRFGAEGEKGVRGREKGLQRNRVMLGGGGCQSRGSFLAALSQALRVPGSAALPLPVWALRRRPLWNVFGGRGPGWAQFHWQAGQREGEPGLPRACSPAPSFMLCYLPG